MKKIKQTTLLALLIMTTVLSGCSGGEMISGALSEQGTVTQEADGSNGTVSENDGENTEADTDQPDSSAPARDGAYTSKDDVAAYLRAYHKLPENFITKKEARSLGWEGGSLEEAAPGKCIGGDYFGNYEGLLPDDEYHECDIDTLGAKSRGSKRLVFSDDKIYYTEDHYKTFDEVE